DESVGYKYRESYVKLFGPDYRPEPYIERAYKTACAHTWYMSARLLTVNDLYAFDPNVKVELDEFTDIVAKHFRQPEEGLGWDDSPPAHMWRTINWPPRYLKFGGGLPRLTEPRGQRPLGLPARPPGLQAPAYPG